MHLRREPLLPGIKVLESRRLTTSHHHNPWFAVDRGSADEDSGEVWFGVLAWSGNWKLAAEVTDFGSDAHQYRHQRLGFRLAARCPATSSRRPAATPATRAQGFGGASRQLHDFIRDTVLPHGHALHKVLYNSWEATFFDVDEVSQIELARHGRRDGRRAVCDRRWLVPWAQQR